MAERDRNKSFDLQKITLNQSPILHGQTRLEKWDHKIGHRVARMTKYLYLCLMFVGILLCHHSNV
jgi:hypothetical protein